MARAVLLTGGNQGDVKALLRRAQQLVNERIGCVMRCSHSYPSPAWGFDSDPFWNQALEVDTDLRPEELLAATQAIEARLGRDRAAEAERKRTTGMAYAARPIDIDIIFYDDLVLSTPALTIPHAGLPGREFALVPLCEIMRERRHPQSGKTMGELLDELKTDRKK